MNPKKKYEDYKKTKPKFFSKGFLILIFIELLIFRWTVFTPLFISFMFRSGIYTKKLNEYKRLANGYEGEALGQTYLSNLISSNFRLFSNVTLESLNAEMDFVVVGDSSITVVEVKNSKGEFVGDPDDKYLMRTKYSSSGESYDDMYYNPIKQVKTHVYKLSEYLKGKGIKDWIDHKVLFLHEESFVYVDYEHLYQYHGESTVNKLLVDIQKRDQNNKNLSNKKKICDILSNVGVEIKKKG